MQGEDQSAGPDPFEDAAGCRRIAKMLLRLFDHWQLDEQARLDLLGMTVEDRGELAAFASATAPLPAGRDTRDRAAYLLAIHKGLRLLYPENPELRYDWVNRRNRAFENLRPIEVMREQGLIGIARVTRYIEHACG